MRKRVVIIVSSKLSVDTFLRNIIADLIAGYDVLIIGNFSGEQSSLENCIFKSIQIYREISFIRDIWAFLQILITLTSFRPSLVLTATPKASLLGQLSSFIISVPVRVHIFTGQVWINKTGIGRHFLKLADRLTAAMSTHIIVDGFEQRNILHSEHIAPLHKMYVNKYGSIIGVDTNYFKPNSHIRRLMRCFYDIPMDAKIVLYLGRVAGDKGLSILCNSLRRILLDSQNSPVYGLIVGPVEDYKLKLSIERLASQLNGKLIFVGHKVNSQYYYCMSDIYCLPSYREGLNVSVIEAGASGIPSVVSDIYGTKETIKDAFNGLRVRAGDVQELERAIRLLIDDETLYSVLKTNSRDYMCTHFNSELIRSEIHRYLQQAISTSC